MKSAFNPIPLHFRDRHKMAFSTLDERALPLTNLLRTDTPFEWTSETQASFEDIKNAILNPPVFALPDPAAALQITTNASCNSIGAVLENRAYHRLSENLFWHNMYKRTKNFVRSCIICLSRKNAFQVPPAPHQPVEQSQEPDAFTKYIHIVPLPDIKSSTISKAFFDNYIVHRGCPHKLVVDNATYFKGSEFLEFCRVVGIQKRHISNYSAHVNGTVEKLNQSLANILTAITNDTNDWDEQLTYTMLALNSAIHEAAYTSPFFLEHDRDIRLSYTYQKNSGTPQNTYEYVDKLLPSLEQIFQKVLENLKEQEASHITLRLPSHQTIQSL
ncbi:integrase catalytic domain-containing protein [Trichonephila inaurata madagascariensis]|uniref:Integrase catalytic domain-containing protein n=1 Tax=Trichonephila inaurata madagascariensis TaxID=2747483 RepID=A0A8X7C2A4_9ARAC|nr:integrase catalytic domain-containing protein [Trichonephila inaurata madagascariensis]